MQDLDAVVPESLHRSSLRARRAFQYSYPRRESNGDSLSSRRRSSVGGGGGSVERNVDWKIDPPMLWYYKEQERARELASLVALALPLSESPSETMPSTSTPAYSATKQQRRQQQQQQDDDDDGKHNGVGSNGNGNRHDDDVRVVTASNNGSSSHEAVGAAPPSPTHDTSATASSSHTRSRQKRGHRKSTPRHPRRRSSRATTDKTTTTTTAAASASVTAEPQMQLTSDHDDDDEHKTLLRAADDNNNNDNDDDGATTRTTVSHEHVHVAAHDAMVQHDGRAHHAMAQQRANGERASASEGGSDVDDHDAGAATHYMDAHSHDERGARATRHHLAAAEAEGLAPVYHTVVHEHSGSEHDHDNNHHQQQHEHDAHNVNGVGDQAAAATHTASNDVHAALRRGASAHSMHDDGNNNDDGKAALRAAQDERHHPSDDAAPQSNREKLHMMVQHTPDPMAPHREAMHEPDHELVPRKAASDTRARVMAAGLPHPEHDANDHASHASGGGAVVVTRAQRHRVPYVVRFHGRDWATVLPQREAEIKQSLVLDITHALRVEPGDVDEVSLEMRDVMVASFAVYQPSVEPEFLRAAKKTLRAYSFINVCKLYPDAPTTPEANTS